MKREKVKESVWVSFQNLFCIIGVGCRKQCLVNGIRNLFSDNFSKKNAFFEKIFKRCLQNFKNYFSVKNKQYMKIKNLFIREISFEKSFGKPDLKIEPNKK